MVRPGNIPGVGGGQEQFARLGVESFGHMKIGFGRGLESLDIVRGKDGLEGVRDPGVFELGHGGVACSVRQRHQTKTGCP